MSIDGLGFRALWLLLLVLPFDPDGRPVALVDGAHLSALDILFYAVGLLAAASVARNLAVAPMAGPRRKEVGIPWGGIAAGLLAATLLSMALSAGLAGRLAAASLWFANVAAGGAIALALPAWLAPNPAGRVAALARALVIGAVAAALLGFGEYLAGSELERVLTVFRPGPTRMGPYLRLASVFHHANIAAMYFEIALCFALAGLVIAVRRDPGVGRHRRLLSLAAWAGAANVLLLALLLTYCRGALLGLMAAAVAAGLALRNRFPARSLRGGARWALIGGANLALLLGLFLSSTSSIEALRLTTSTDESWFLAGFGGAPPAQMRAGGHALVRVTVHNLSPLSWQAKKPGEFALSYHWLYPSLRVARFDTVLSPLPSPLPAGGSESVQVDVQAPRRPDRYVLIWDLLWDHTTWFDLKTGNLVSHRVRVVDPATSVIGRADRSTRPALPRYLPIARAPDRTSVWRIALRAFLRRPAFGGGLHAFRAAYREDVPLAPDVSPPPHAHDLLLEMLDNWGLVGTALLALLATALWGPLLVSVRRGRPGSAWEVVLVAAAAAFLAHSAVDYFLGATSVFGVVCILSGLAAGAGNAAMRPSVIQNSSSTAREPSK